jgi:hypothetical protein
MSLRVVLGVPKKMEGALAIELGDAPWGFRSKTKGRSTLSQVVFSTNLIMLLMRPGEKRHGAPAGRHEQSSPAHSRYAERLVT